MLQRLCTICLVILAVTACSRSDEPELKAQPNTQQNSGPAPAVTVARVVVRNVAPEQRYIGRVTAIQAVQVVARVTAFIEEVPVKQGSNVKAGQVIYRLDASQYQAALELAQAQLASAQAALRLAQLTYQRTARLRSQGAAPQATLDQAVATRDQDQANVQAAQANLEQAQLNLSYCTITSPIDGRIGAITLTKGNLVTPTTPSLATINQLDPIRVVFSVSDRVMTAAEQSTSGIETRIAPGLPVKIELPDGSAYDQTGKVAFLNNEVDPQTGTVSIYADFPNPDALLLPGTHVNVLVTPAKPEAKPLVPVEAVQTEQSGSFVLVVGQDNKVVQQPVALGRQIGQNFIVEKGLSGGERVITQGLQKVHSGETVNPAEAPAAPPPAQAGPASSTVGRGG
ncbi:MAG TPA: efflux RND transporter periplasmic adaptor subunit [Xanthobacteraceae bacterium]|jgi:membrane fusion protein (multidrug efflux system)